MVRANWELIPLAVLQTAALTGLGIASLLPFYFVLDVEALDLYAGPEAGAAWVSELTARLYERLGSPALWLAVLSSAAVLVAALACYSFFQAGIFGVLTTADRQAPRSASGHAAWFRTYSWAEFQGRGGRDLWRFFWLFHLVLLLGLAWSLLAALALVAAGVVAGSGGFGAGVAVGCAAVLPLGFLLVLLTFCALFSQAVVAGGDRSAWFAVRAGLRLATRRLGAVALLFAVALSAYFAVAMFFLVLSLPLGGGLLAAGGARMAATLVLQAAQWSVTALLQLVVAAAVVVVVGGERRVEGAGHVVVAG